MNYSTLSNDFFFFFVSKVDGELHHIKFNEQSCADKLPQCFYNGLFLFIH